MFYLTSKFHDNCDNTFGFMEGEGFWSPPPQTQTQEIQKSPGATLQLYLLELQTHLLVLNLPWKITFLAIFVLISA